MPIVKLDKQQVLGALKATGSSDADVLYARKEEMLAESRRMKLLGIGPIVVGTAMSLTIIGAVVGIPVIIFGVTMKNRIKRNTKVAEEAYQEYMDRLGGKAQPAVA